MSGRTGDCIGPAFYDIIGVIVIFITEDAKNPLQESLIYREIMQFQGRSEKC